ncbi:MAG: hypothetical protein ABJB78_09420, partial [Betaproteobacteria bacterium]
KMATSAQLLDTSAGANQIFYLDGMKVGAATAHGIAKDRIATIDVKKLNGATEIHIATLAAPRERNADGSTGPIRFKVTDRQMADSGRHEVGTMELSRTGGTTAVRSREKFEGLVFVDGVQSSDKNILSKLNPKDIVNVEVIKGKMAAEQSSDPAAVNGIIRITTKAGAAK